MESNSSTQIDLAQKDPLFEEIINTIPLPLFQSTGNVFHDLMSCIVEQQIHYRSTKKTFEKALAKAELRELTPADYPQFESLGLKGIKLSARKQETLIDIVSFWEKHDIDWASLEDKEVRERLSSIRGVGKWTIDMLLMYTLHRPNIFPIDDYHLKIAMQALYGLESKSLKRSMREIAKKWHPHQSLAVRYLLEWKRIR